MLQALNVGTATLGALLGAGGYGEPIFAGVRLVDFDLIMECAAPAALLALLSIGSSIGSASLSVQSVGNHMS